MKGTMLIYKPDGTLIATLLTGPPQLDTLNAALDV